jgi:hypothetical protein
MSFNTAEPAVPSWVEIEDGSTEAHQLAVDRVLVAAV